MVLTQKPIRKRHRQLSERSLTGCQFGVVSAQSKLRYPRDRGGARRQKALEKQRAMGGCFWQRGARGAERDKGLLWLKSGRLGKRTRRLRTWTAEDVDWGWVLTPEDAAAGPPPPSPAPVETHSSRFSPESPKHRGSRSSPEPDSQSRAQQDRSRKGVQRRDREEKVETSLTP